MKTTCLAVLALFASAAGAQAQSTTGATQGQTAATAQRQSSCGLACAIDDSAPAAPASANGTKVPRNLGKLAQNKSDLDRVICEKQETIGTRLGAKKVCMTVAQWIEFQNDVKDQTRRIEILGAKSN